MSSFCFHFSTALLSYNSHTMPSIQPRGWNSKDLGLFNIRLASEPISEHFLHSRMKPQGWELLRGMAHVYHVWGLGSVPSYTTAEGGPYPHPLPKPSAAITTKLLCLCALPVLGISANALTQCVDFGVYLISFTTFPGFTHSGSAVHSVTAVYFATSVLSTVDGRFMYHEYQCHDYSSTSFCGDKSFPLS